MLRGNEGVQVGGTAAGLQKSVRGGSGQGIERPGRSVGEGQANSQGSSHPVHRLDTQLSGEVTASLEPHRRPGRMNEDSSEFPREPHVLSILPIRAHIDKVKSLKRSDVYIGRGCKERLLMPSFWANRYKVARYGRTRCLALHKREIEEDLQYERRIHELTGRGCCATVARTSHVTGTISSSSISGFTPTLTTEGSQTGRLLQLNSTHSQRPGTSAPTARSQSWTRRLPVHHKVGVGTTVR